MSMIHRPDDGGSRCLKKRRYTTTKPRGAIPQKVSIFKFHHHHHSEHGQGLGLKTCSFEAQGVPGPSILLSVFPYPAIPEVGTGKPR
jgi:hypothetical protein